MHVASKAHTGSPKSILPWPVRGSLFLGIVIGLELAVWFCGSVVPLVTTGRADFRNLYTAGYMVRTGHARQLYDYNTELAFQNSLVSPLKQAMPYLRPAYESLLFVPFSFLSYETAYLIFLFFNCVLLALSYRMLRPHLNHLAAAWRLLPAAIFLSFIPVIIALAQGQDSLMFLALMVLAFLCLEHGNEGWAGVLVGLGVSKLQVLVPLILLFLSWKRWRFVGGFSLSATLCLAISVWLVGIAGIGTYLHVLTNIHAVASIEQLSQYRHAALVIAMPNLRGLIFAWLGPSASASLASGLQLLIALAVLLPLALLNSTTHRSSDLFLIALTASCFVSYYLFVHDLSLVLLPIVVTMDHSLVPGSAGDKHRRWVLQAATLMFIAPACAAFFPAYLYLVSIPLSIFLVASSFFVSMTQELQCPSSLNAS